MLKFSGAIRGLRVECFSRVIGQRSPRAADRAVHVNTLANSPKDGLGVGRRPFCGPARGSGTRFGSASFNLPASPKYAAIIDIWLDNVL